MYKWNIYIFRILMRCAYERLFQENDDVFMNNFLTFKYWKHKTLPFEKK